MKAAKRRIGRRLIGLLAMMVASASMGLYFSHAVPASATNTVSVWLQTMDSCRTAVGGAHYQVTGPGLSNPIDVVTPNGSPSTVNNASGCPLPAGNCTTSSATTTETSTLTSTQQSAVTTSTGVSTTATSMTATGTTTVTSTITTTVKLGTTVGCVSINNLPVPASGTSTFTILETATPPPDVKDQGGFAPCSGGSACQSEVATVTVDSLGNVQGWTTTNTYPDGGTTTWSSTSGSPGSLTDPVMIHDFGLPTSATIDPCSPESGVPGTSDADADDYLTGTPSSHCPFLPESAEGVGWCSLTSGPLAGVAFPWACSLQGGAGVAKVGVSIDPNSLPADGRSTATVTATVTDSGGTGVPGVNVSFSTTDGSIASPVMTNSFGHATSSLTVGIRVGTQTVTAKAANVPGSATFTLTAPPAGYYMDATDGGIFAFGNGAPFYGSMGGQSLNAPIIGMAAVPNGGGYWEVASDGGLFAFGPAAKFYGSMGGRPLNAPIVGMAATGDGRGYYLVASDGGIFAYGNAAFYGSMGGQPLNKPIVGIAVSPRGGYWEVASDGGIFAFGPGAGFYGSMGGKPLNAPIVTMASTGNGQGYWMTASDGGIFAFGNAPFHGSMGGKPLNKPIVGMDATRDGKGYWLVASDGGIFAFNAPFFGSMGGQPLAAPIVGMTSAT